MGKLLMLLLPFWGAYYCYAQQDIQYTQYYVNPFAINPALAGTEDYLHLQSGVRTQWLGFQAAPLTTFVSAHSTIGKMMSGYGKHKNAHAQSWSGIGGIAYADNTGPFKKNAIYFSYAYNLALNKSWRLASGFSGGMKNLNYNPNDYLINIAHAGDPVIENSFSKYMADANVGFWLYSKNYYVGLSMMQLLRNSFTTYPDMYLLQKESALNRHLYGMFGFKKAISSDLNIIPSVFVKYVNPAPVSFDFNLKTVYRKNYWAALSYRKGDALAMAVGLVFLDKVECSYSFDLIYSGIRKDAYGSHELILGYRFPKRKKGHCPDLFW